jgi:hypothetical protein
MPEKSLGNKAEELLLKGIGFVLLRGRRAYCSRRDGLGSVSVLSMAARRQMDDVHRERCDGAATAVDLGRRRANH